MFEQLRAVAQTYTTKSWFQGMCLVSLAWLGLVMWLMSTGMLPDEFAKFASILLIIWGMWIGLHLNSQFVSSQARLLPEFAVPHLAIAAGLCGMISVVLIAVAAFASVSPAVAAEWEGITRIGLLAFGWSLFLLCISVSFNFRALGNALALPFLLFLFSFIKVTGPGSSFWLSIVKGGPALALMLVVNPIFTYVLVRRICRLHEGTMEAHSQEWLDPTLNKRRVWSRQRGGLSRVLNRTDRVLDSIRRPIGSGFGSHVRHFQLGLGGQANFIILVPVLVALFSVIHFICYQISKDLFTSQTGWSLSCAVYGIWCGQFQVNGRTRFQWITLLPMRREQILFRNGIALLVYVLKLWFTIAIPIYIVACIPFPGVPHHFPALWPFVDSLAAQLPFFGIVTLTLAKPRAVGAYIAGGVVLLALMGASELNASGLPLLPPVTLLAGGVCLILWSYRRWLQLDLS